MKKARLSPRHQRFVDEYLVDLNAAEAALRAGYAGADARNYGSWLLRHRGIRTAIEKALAAREEKARITSDRILQEYGRMAFADIRNFADWGPAGITLREKTELSDADAAAIADIQPHGSNGKGGRIKLYDKMAALDALARHVGLFHPSARRSDRSAAGDEARKILRERILKLMGK